MRMKKREFITLDGGAVGWPLAARAATVEAIAELFLEISQTRLFEFNTLV